MSCVQRTFTNLRCDICGKEAALLARSARDARSRATNWQTWRRKHNIYDTCGSCEPREGWVRA